MKIAITGHRGYIGLVLSKLLRIRGHYVVGIDSDIFSDSRITHITDAADKELIKDFRDVTEDDLYGINAIVHLAGLSNDPICNLNPDLTFAVNHKAATRLAVISKNAGLNKFVFASSCSVYGETKQMLVDESHPTNPLTPYSVTKVLVEEDLYKLSSANFVTFSMRFSTAYGWSSSMRFDLVINNLVASASAENKLVVRDSPGLWRPFVHIEDIAGSIIAALELQNPNETSHVLNIGSNEDNYLVSDLINIIKNTLPIKLSISYAPNGLDKRSYWIDASRMARIFSDFRPKWNVPAGVSNLFSIYQQNHLTADIYLNRRFRRIDHVVDLTQRGSLNSDLRWVR